MSVAQIHQLDHHHRPFADVVPFVVSPLRVREMVRSMWVLVIMLWFAKFDASRVYQREKNPILEEAIQGATVRLCHLMENHWPTLFPYIRGMMIREIKKPMVSTVSDMKMKASRLSDLMLEPDALQPFLPPPEEVRKAEKLAQLWHPGKHLPVQDTEDTTGFLRHFRRLAGSLTSARYAFHPAGKAPTVHHFQAPKASAAASGKGLEAAGARLQENLTCSEQQGEKFLQSFQPLGGIFEGPRLYSKHPTSNLTTIFLTFGSIDSQLTHTLCHRLVREQDNYNVLFLSVKTFEEATGVLHQVMGLVQDAVKDVTLIWFDPTSSFDSSALKSPPNAMVKDFLHVLQLLLSSNSSRSHGLLLDFISVLPTTAEVAQHFSRQLPGVPVYALKDRLCEGKESDDEVIHCRAVSWKGKGFPAVFLSETTPSPTKSTQSTQSILQPEDFSSEIFEFYDGVTFPGDEALCELWCSMISECGSLVFTQLSGTNVGMCVLSSPALQSSPVT